MATTYCEAKRPVYDLMREVIATYFPTLEKLDPPLEIAVEMATAEDGPALKRLGSVVAARIKIVSGEDRAMGGPDLKILIDEHVWGNEPEEGQKALLAHELYHIEPQYDGDPETGEQELKLDAYGRPVVKLKPDDWMLTGFYRVAEWFGPRSFERRGIGAVADRLRQAPLPFAGPEPASSVTVSGGGKSVTLTGEQFQRISEMPGPAPLHARVEQLDREADEEDHESYFTTRPDPSLKSGVDLVTSRPGSDPAANGVEPAKAKRKARKAKAKAGG